MISYVLTFAEGILTFISPCILSMLPVYMLYLAGARTGADNAPPSRKNRLIVNSLGFAAGFTIVFVTLGAAAAIMGTLLQRNRPVLLMVSGAFMVLFGLNFTGVLRIGFLNAEKRFSPKVDNLRFWSSVLFGIVFGFGWSPCLGTFLGSALALAGNSKTVAEGMLLLLVYSAGLHTFIISAAIFENVRGLFLVQQDSGSSGSFRHTADRCGVWFFKDGWSDAG